jgi:DNA-directed RNA polymerase subunit M/transcription elongation factor TFIIS
MEEKKRTIMLVCGKCGNHDINGDTLLEIDFKEGSMSYVCRNCNHENMIKLNAVPSSYPRIGIQR